MMVISLETGLKGKQEKGEPMQTKGNLECCVRSFSACGVSNKRFGLGTLSEDLIWSHNQNPVLKWSTQNHVKDLAGGRSYLWCGLSLTNLHLPGCSL